MVPPFSHPGALDLPNAGCMTSLTRVQHFTLSHPGASNSCLGACIPSLTQVHNPGACLPSLSQVHHITAQVHT